MAQLKFDKPSVTGGLVADPVQRETPDGLLTTLRVGTHPRVFNNETREWQDGQPTYVDVAITNERLGQNVMDSLKRGDLVTVRGNYEAVPYMKKDGTAGLNHRIWADGVSTGLDYRTVKISPDQAALASAQLRREAERAREQEITSVAAEPANEGYDISR